MRLGKEQAAGYVEDTETVPAAEEIQISHPESALATADPEPAVPAG
jgi:hypothetical protein